MNVFFKKETVPIFDSKGKDVLVIGHAGKPWPEAVTLDINPEAHPDVVHDLQCTPWPFEDNAFGQIVAHHVLEHLSDVTACMGELYRVCRKDGEIYIETPHHTSWFARSCDHKLYFSYFSFEGHLVENAVARVKGKKFICLKREVTFHKVYRMFFLHKLFNKFPLAYERFFCYWFPAEHVKWWLTPHRAEGRA